MFERTTLNNLQTTLFPWSPSKTDIETCFNQLLALYGASDRHYHNRNHIETTLRAATKLYQQAENPINIQLALWFHDAIYDTHAADNEEQSAALAQKWLTRFGLPPSQIADIEQLILDTKIHTPTTNDGRLIIDIDLAILAQPPAIYQTYSQAIRQEYSWVPETQYRTGRAQILQAFLQRPHIYHTAIYQQTHEPQARQNLHQEIQILTQTKHTQ